MQIATRVLLFLPFVFSSARVFPSFRALLPCHAMPYQPCLFFYRILILAPHLESLNGQSTGHFWAFSLSEKRPVSCPCEIIHFGESREAIHMLERKGELLGRQVRTVFVHPHARCESQTSDSCALSRVQICTCRALHVLPLLFLYTTQSTQVCTLRFLARLVKKKQKNHKKKNKNVHTSTSPLPPPCQQLGHTE